MKNRVIFSVTNDIVFDQRVNRIAGTLLQEGAEILVVAPLLNFHQYSKIHHNEIFR